MFKTTFQSQLVSTTAWIAPGATVVGDVELADNSSVWFGAVLRGDTAWIRIGPRSNVQDLACLHVDEGVPCTIGSDVTIGHSAVVHAATVADRVLVGIRAVVLSGAVIGEESLIAAGAVVLEGQRIPPRSLVVGIPGKVIRVMSDVDVERIRTGAAHYVQASAAFRSQV